MYHKHDVHGVKGSLTEAELVYGYETVLLWSISLKELCFYLHLHIALLIKLLHYLFS